MQTILIWGTGSRADMLMELLDLDTCSVLGFLDSDPAKHGTQVHGAPVHAPDTLPGLDFDALIIASSYSAEILPHALALGVDRGKIHLASRTAPEFLSKFCKQEHRAAKDDLALARETRWYHKFELTPGMETNGKCPFNPEKLNYFEAIDSPDKKTVLDIGAWDGPYTFEMERRGAQVTGFDIQDPDNSGFNLAKRLKKSSAEHIMDNVYNLSPGKHGTYDIVLYLGVWYHLKNPLQALANIHAVLNPGGLLVFEGAILDHADTVDSYWAGQKELLKTLVATPTCFYAADEYSNDDSNWFVPTSLCLRDWLTSSGFEILALDVKRESSRAWGAARRIDDFYRAEHGLV